jgi:tetratricopeptide (TPR) repeat protein
MTAAVGSFGSAPQMNQADLKRVRSLREAGQFHEATRFARDYVAINPTDPAGQTELGLVHLYANRVAEAAAWLGQAVRLAPGSADNHYNLGIALERLGRDRDAIAGLRQAIAIDANHPAALERLGNLLMKYGRRDEATECYRRVALLQPNSLMGRVSRAKMLAEEGKPDEAETLLRQTVILFPASAQAKQLLAIMLREQGRFDEAIPLLWGATQGSPEEAATAYYDLAMSKKITTDDMPMLQEMRGLLGLGTLPDVYHPRLHFGLGKALDELGAYGDAMRHFDEANRIARRGQSFDRARVSNGVQRTIARFTVEFFDALAPLGSSSEVPLLILGMPRSGTTLVEQIVSNHRDVAAGGELNFWNSKIEAFAGPSRDVREGNAARTAEEYLAMLRRIDPDAVRVTDKAPGNFLWIGVIRIVFPKARIVHCRRHPVDTCLSNYFTNFRESLPFSYSKADLAFYYQNYARLMEHWRTVLSPDYFHEIDYELLVADPEPVTRRLIDFCGLDWDDACLRPETNRRSVKSASAWQVRQPTYRTSTGRWRHYEPWLGDLRQLLKPETAAPLPGASMVRAASD